MHRTAATFALIICATGLVLADVRTDEKSQVKFEGALGRVVNFFAGKAARVDTQTQLGSETFDDWKNLSAIARGWRALPIQSSARIQAR